MSTTNASFCSRSHPPERHRPHALLGWVRSRPRTIQENMKAVLPAGLLVLLLTAPAFAQADTTTTTAPDTTTTVPTTTTAVTLPIPTTTFTVPTITLPTTTTITPTTTTLRPGCSPGDPGSCDDGNPCTVDSCIGAFLTCVHHPLDATPCPDDGVFCTADRCVAGVCPHPPSDPPC